MPQNDLDAELSWIPAFAGLTAAEALYQSEQTVWNTSHPELPEIPQMPPQRDPHRHRQLESRGRDSGLARQDLWGCSAPTSCRSPLWGC